MPEQLAQLYEAILEASVDAIVAINSEGRVTVFNRAAERMFGWTKEEMLGQPLERLMPDEYREKHADYVRSYFATGKPDGAIGRTLELPAVRKNGERFTVELSLAARRGEDGFVVAMMRDIEKRKQAEQRVAQLNAVLRAIRDVNELLARERDRDKLIQGVCESLTSTRGFRHAWIALADDQCRFVSAAEAGLGKEAFAPLVGMMEAGQCPICADRAMEETRAVIIRDVATECPTCPVRECCADNAVMVCALRHGERMCGVLSVSVPQEMADDEEQVTLFEEAARDIAFALHAIDIEKRRRRAQMIVEASTDAIIAIDERGLVIEYNPAAEKLFGWSREEMLGEPLQCIIPEQYRERHREAVRSFFATGKPDTAIGSTVELPALRKDGSEITIEVSLAAERGKDALVVGIVRDATERKRAREALEAAHRKLQIAQREAEEASRLKSEFLANTSHEIRTPLNGILGYLQLLRDGLYESPEEQQQFIQGAIDAANHLMSLLNDVLDIAKIEAGKLKLEVTGVSMAETLEHIRSLTHVQAANKGIELNIEPPDPELYVRADANRLNQVLLNLVGNALKFTPKGGKVTVRATANREQGYVLCEVIDTGIGLSPEDKRVIFEAFRQVDGSTTREHGGAGLGLAISRQLVGLMGGVMGAESEGRGKGSRFYFTLPIHRPGKELYWRRREDVEAALVPQGPEGGPLVLVVEDDPEFSELLRLTLQKHGFRTVYAATADDGLEAARRLRPDAITLDYGLPARDDARLRDGWDLLSALRTDPALADIPVVIVTGYQDVIGQRLSVTWLPPKCEWLNKPVECKQVVEHIRALVGKRGEKPVRVLVADDDPAVHTFLQKVLGSEGFTVVGVFNGQECLEYIASHAADVDLLILDLMMPERDGFDVLRELRFGKLAPELPVIVFTNYPEAMAEHEEELSSFAGDLAVFGKPQVYANQQAFIDRLRALVSSAKSSSEQ